MSAHVHEQLAYYAGLSPEERRAVDLHCAGCTECRETRAAYERQDAALAALPTLRPRRSLRPRPEAGSARALGYLGNALALAGLAALIWLFALQLEAGARGGWSVPAAPEPGVTLPPASVALPSPWLPALPWLGFALLFTGLSFILARGRPWLTIAGAAVALVLLTGYVPPFSSVPNPAGLYWRLAGGYAYDPRLPFKNEFVVAGSPDRQLAPYLDQLVGLVGLTPLDPVQPLARYEILRVALDAQHTGVAIVSVRFIYADASSRVYPVPVFHPAFDTAGFWLSGWENDGLARLRSEHVALPGVPFAEADAGLRLGHARRLDLAPTAERLDEVNPGHWLWESARVQRLVMAPGGDAFLASFESAPGVRRLWLVPLDGGPPVPVGPEGYLGEYGWSPDGRSIVYTRMDADALALDPEHPYAVMVASRDDPAHARALVTAQATAQLPGLNAQGIWFFSQGSLWVAPYEGAPSLVRAAISPEPSSAPRPAPDGETVAYGCGSTLCLLDVRDATVRVVPGLPEGSLAEMAWSADGTRLAVVDRDRNDLRPVQLLVLARDGVLQFGADIAPGAATDSPLWLPDGRAVLVQTYPLRGRRIVAVDLAAGAAIDLSRAHWDAYFTLAPDGRHVVLNNGRGDFWVAEVIR